jgi:hypothetical protein
MDERRKTKRAPVELPARWESTSGVYEGSVNNISVGGCFLRSAGSARARDPIKVEIQLPTGRWIYVWGVVVRHTAEKGEEGFAVRFTVIDEKQLGMLNLLMEYVDE